MGEPLTSARRPSAAVGKVLDAAEQVFSESGFAGARIDEIAARAGMAKSHVYYHFAGKQQIFDALIEARLGELLAQKQVMLEQFEDATPTPHELGAWLTRAVSELLGSQSAFLRIVLVETLASGGGDRASLLSRVLTPVLDDIVARVDAPGLSIDTDRLRSDALWFGLIPAVLHVVLLEDASAALGLPVDRVSELFLARLASLEGALLTGLNRDAPGPDMQDQSTVTRHTAGQDAASQDAPGEDCHG